ncbi:MAG: KpsF/GutQ family sugar-phosphate isomerase [Gemmataceae bacterium]
MNSASNSAPRPQIMDRLGHARKIVLAEAQALRVLADRLTEDLADVIDGIAACRGRVAVSGVGKCDPIARKIVATLNSTGTRAYILDATAALHGDLGMIAPEDVALLLSNSGESEELVRLLPPLRSMVQRIYAITGNATGTLAKTADAAVIYGSFTEVCPNQLAPSTTTTVMLALGDSIALTVSTLRGFTAEDFARFHPSGSLGLKLATVEQVMRRGEELRTAQATDTIRDVFAKSRQKGRRTGAILLLDSQGQLAGFFTDSDLARLFESKTEMLLDRPIAEIMTRQPITVPPTMKLTEAVALLKARKISELPVVDTVGRPVGLLDITDVIGMTATTARPILRVRPSA